MSAVVEYADERTAGFRKTLDRLPDEIALAIGLRVFDLAQPDTCVCGWAVREALAREAGLDAESCDINAAENHSGRQAAHKFGGNYWDDWSSLYWGATDSTLAPLVEEALFDRVMAAVENAKPASRSRGSRKRAGR